MAPPGGTVAEESAEAALGLQEIAQRQQQADEEYEAGSKASLFSSNSWARLKKG